MLKPDTAVDQIGVAGVAVLGARRVTRDRVRRRSPETSNHVMPLFVEGALVDVRASLARAVTEDEAVRD